MAKKVDHGKLRPVPVWWIGLYGFAAFWLLLVSLLDASHFGPGFFPLMVSLVLVPLLAIVFLFDLFVRIAEAVLGKRSSLIRRLGPVVVSSIGAAVYGRFSVVYLMAHA